MRKMQPEDLQAISAQTFLGVHVLDFDREFARISPMPILDLSDGYEEIDPEIIDGLMLNKSIINGGGSYSNTQPGLKAKNKTDVVWMDRCDFCHQEWTGCEKTYGGRLICPRCARG